MIKSNINKPESSRIRKDGTPVMVIAGSGFLLGDAQMEKLCECGCGKPTLIAKLHDKRYGHVKGEPVRFIYGHHPKGEKSHSWKGGYRMYNGRKHIYAPNHPKVNMCYVPNYVLIVEKIIGRYLPSKAVVHHIDGNPKNDKNNNLVACENTGYHSTLHRRKRSYDACGNAKWRKCYLCQRYDDPKNLYIPPIDTHGSTVYHRECKNKRARELYLIHKHSRKENDYASNSVRQGRD